MTHGNRRPTLPNAFPAAALVLAALLLVAVDARTQEAAPAPAPGAADLVPDDLNPLEEPKIPVGWNRMLKASGNLALSHNKNVVKPPDFIMGNIVAISMAQPKRSAKIMRFASVTSEGN